MHTQCPHCGTLNIISADQLETTDGSLLCWHCEERFTASENLSAQELEDSAQFSIAYLDMAVTEAEITNIKAASYNVNFQTEAEQTLAESKPDYSEMSDGFDSQALEQFSYELADLKGSTFVTNDITSEYGFITEELGEVSIDTGFSLQGSSQDKEPVDETHTPDETSTIRVERTSDREIDAESEAENEALPAFEVDPEHAFVEEQKLEVGSQAQLETDSEVNVRHEEPPVDPPELPFDVPDGLPEIQPAKDAPSLYDDLLTKKRSNRRFGLWSLIVIILLILALGQLTWLGRSHLMQYEEGRQLFRFICRYAGCRMPARRAPDKIEILSRIVEMHPEKAGTLRVQLTFANSAPFPQPYPKIHIELYDIKEMLVALRSFQPDEYLGKIYNGESLQPDEILDVEMQLQDPGDEVSGFRFEFY